MARRRREGTIEEIFIQPLLQLLQLVLPPLIRILELEGTVRTVRRVNSATPLLQLPEQTAEEEEREEIRLRLDQGLTETIKTTKTKTMMDS